MKKNLFWLQLRNTVFFVLCMSVADTILATEPLHDGYVVGSKTGFIFPSECCWMQLPPSERLTKMKREELGCSAIGGPVGRFKLESGKLWLTGLLNCGDAVDLHDVYPGLENPVFANWLTGTFTAQVEFVCYKGTQRVYSEVHVLNVEQGIVTSVTETRNDTSACSGNTGR